MSPPFAFPWLRQRGEFLAWRCADGSAAATYAAMNRRLERLMEALPPGQILATHAPNSPAHLEWILAALQAGRTILPLLHRWPESQARKTARDYGASAFLIGSPSGVTWELGEIASCSLPNGPATLILTSGSTAAPKAVWHPLAAHLAAAEASQNLLPIGPGSAWLLDLPLAHVSGLAIAFRCLQQGGTIIFPDKSAARVWPKGTTHLSLVAPQLAKMLSLEWPADERPAVLAGGGPFPTPLLSNALQRGLPIFLTYGMTETASQICTRRLSLDDVSPECSEGLIGCGVPLTGWELCLSEVDEIKVRGANLARGYFRPGGEMQPITDAEGWFSTGDVGRFDATVGWQLIGRKDRMFISGGENIHPELIEHHLQQIPGVLRARVVPRPDPIYGQRPVAFIAGQWSPSKLTDLLRLDLPKFCLPELYLPWPEHLEPTQPKLRDRDFLEVLATHNSNEITLLSDSRP